MATDEKLLLAFYGDDFTGSTDALEALAKSGLRTVLFLSSPTPELIREKFPDLRCVGVAGTSRAMSPAEMDTEFEPVLRQLWSIGAPVTHYKVCSTFDSSPEIGSIGHVADMVHTSLVPGQMISIVAGAPPLRRFTVFGNHFAAYGEEVYRLDRHPVMSRHPSTPMHESDLRVHLSHQTRIRIGLMSVTDLSADAERVDACQRAKLEEKPGMLLYDALTDEHLLTVGRLLWQHGQRAPHFVIGSSGVEYALAAHWRASGIISDQRAEFEPLKPVEQMLAVSGSASPMTAQQIEWAGNNGFDCIRIPTEKLAQPDTAEQAQQQLVAHGLESLSAGSSVLLYSAAGPDDPSIHATRERLDKSGGRTARVLGTAMGNIARELLKRSGLRRVVIAGGDTSSYATQELGLYALEMLAELTPGAPLCRAYSDDPQFDGLEIALKGGQMGKVDYFGMVRGQ
ncbi:MAG: four-carbon acid sugar kinase family protein [Betaproteobacteria bacterium]|nr:MAG: four-carbon acid sugar kinase family protein [Betaproteobacteria bacterium]